MKKWFIRIVVGLIVIFIVLISAMFIMEKIDKVVVEKYVENENLKTVKADWRGTAVDAKGRFVNHEFPFVPKMSDVLKWQLSANPSKKAKAHDTERLRVLDPAEFLDGEKDGILWLGHASFFIRLEGKTILIDPVFGNPPLVKTFVDVASPLDALKTVDFILISHDHRDHADENSLNAVTKKFPQAKILTGLRMDELLKDWIQPPNSIETAGWYQQFSTSVENLKITFLPARHWSRRGLFDTNRRLWGAFMIESGSRTIYFGGDSGYGAHFAELENLFPPINVFIVGIGAYEPRWFMEPNHQSPEDALRAFRDSGAEILIPMHFGLFDLSDEPPNEPWKILKNEAEKAGLSERVKMLAINESLNF